MNRSLAALFLGGVALVLLGAAAASRWNPAVARGILAGGLWNLASVWCLVHLLDAWIGPRPSRTRAIAWALAKFPLLYLAVLGLFYTSAISLVGFGIGFTAILIMAIGWFAWRGRMMAAAVRS